MISATDPRGTETEIHRGLNHRVIRVIDPTDGPLIIKQVTDHGDADIAQSALHNEQRILERLQGVAGCPRLVRFSPAQRELAVADFGGVALEQSSLLGHLDLERFLTVAEALARIVAAIHERGVIHKDLNPANVLIRRDDLRLQIINFDLATTFAEEHPEFEYPRRIHGTLAYLSPEQTGRMNRPVDYRTDLYSLGATLYALATGAPPFEEVDPLSLIYAHLARSPLPPQDRAPWLPPRGSELILTLLAKEPDDRYQSAAGLAHDLRRLREAVTAHAPLDSVCLQVQDLPLSPRPPRRLYGRDRELATLMATFTRVTEGSSQNVFVAGYSGVGKTSLIHEIHRPVTLKQGLFISGKFEQFQRNRPFLAPAQSLRQLCQLLLAESAATVVQWRERILAGVGPDAGALFEVAPELETLLGPQAPAPELGPREAQVRLRNLLVALLRQVAAPAHPLVLFLDDLQWADQPSLDFIGALLEETTLTGLLLIGAYRDNEVDAAHPLARLLRQPTVTGNPALVLTLASLTMADLADLLADMLHMPPDAVQPLAAALYAKTSGNPFFTVELLNVLYREGALRPDPERGQWRWEDTALLARPVSANVADLLAENLADLADATAETLVAAAGLGNACTFGLLARATGTDAETLAERLTPALERGILMTPSALAFRQADPSLSLRFCHDRMQQAVYLLRNDAWRGQLHLAMARRFAQASPDPVYQFSAAEHYATAAPLLIEPAERVIARQLFCNAAVQARQAGSFATAERFLRLGIAMLAADAWQSDPDAAFALYAELHLVLDSLGRQAAADEIYALLAVHASSVLGLVAPACIQIASLTNRTRYEDAIALGCRLLAPLDMAPPLDDLPQAVEEELERFYAHVQEGALERLPDSPALEDSQRLAAAKLMSRMASAALFSQPMLMHWIVLRIVRLWIEDGFHAIALRPAGALISLTITHRGDFATGYHLARVALATGLARECGVETAQVQHMYGLFNSHWFQSLDEDWVLAHAAFDGLLRGGDLTASCFTFFTSLAALLDTCGNLADMNVEIAAALRFARKTGNQHGEQSYLTYQQLVHALEGKTAQPGSFAAAEFDEQAQWLAVQGNSMALCHFHSYRALAACLFNNDAALIRHAAAAASLTPYITGFYLTALVNLLHSLALIQQIRAMSAVQRPLLLEQLAANQNWLAARARDAPMNFRHLYDWVEAERLDVLDQPWDALQRFQQAMRQAQAHQRPWHHALVTERAGQCYLRHGLEHAGRALLAQAHKLYRQWGADGKARAMRSALPFLDASDDPGNASNRYTDVLDYQALLRASQALASERSLRQLVARVVELVSQLTGATDARLMLLDEKDGWYLEGGLRGNERLSRRAWREAEAEGIIAASVLRLGLKTLQPVVSEDAVIDSRFTADPHFANLRLCSLLALPVLVHGRVSAFLTLENRLFRAAFTAERIETVALLCAQLAISIENVQLYESLERKVAERTCALEAANRQLAILSATDSLTGLANRRRFDEVLLTEWQRATRSRQPLGLAMLDVDWFKHYNDTYGHQAGDECLRMVAQVLKTQARRVSDLVARYGGEEFTLIVPETSAENMLSLAKALQTALEALALPHAESAFGHVTVSIGIAVQVPTVDATPEQLLQRADAALYRAKIEGRNRIAG